MGNSVTLEIAHEVATLTLCRPAQLNALSEEMMADFAAAVAGLRKASGLGAVVITGAGGNFMAGGDIRDFARRLGLGRDARLSTFRALIEQHINAAVETLQALPVPVIASVRGACAGFGFSLMAGCDFAVAAEDVVFTTAYRAIGLSGDGGVSYFLPRIVGTRRALELLMLGERFDAAEALRLGLVNQVVPADGLDAAVAALVARCLAGPRHAHAEIKQLVQASFDNRLEAQLQSEAEAFARCAATADFDEGVRAFLDKRQPDFGQREKR
jgi:2-(1,2-epoxy-1,2-dihydrophenyl)acetyl-CoA isomerase